MLRVSTFEIDPDITRARTLPADVYRDPAWFARPRAFRRDSPGVRVRRADRAGARAPRRAPARATRVRSRRLARVPRERELGALLRQLPRGVPRPLRAPGAQSRARLCVVSHR